MKEITTVLERRLEQGVCFDQIKLGLVLFTRFCARSISMNTIAFVQ